MGLKSGLRAAGKARAPRPPQWRADYAGHFMAGRLSSTTASPGWRVGARICSTYATKAGPFPGQRGGQAVRSQRGHDGRRLPVPVRDGGDEACAAGTPPVAAGQLGLDRGLIHEDEAGAVEVGRLGAPALAGGHHMPILFSGAQDFFLRSALSRARRDGGQPTETPKAARSSARVASGWAAMRAARRGRCGAKRGTRYWVRCLGELPRRP